MKKFAIVILSLASAISAFAQTKTVTNADLEKFRQQRVESERNLRAEYARKGFPSPEQIEQQNRQRRFEMEQYSDQLRTQRLQSENGILAQANALRTQIASIDAQINYLRRNGGGYSNQGFIYSNQGLIYSGGYAPYGSRRNRSVLPQIQNLPPNMRTVQEYGAMYPSAQSLFNESIGNVRVGGNVRLGSVGIVGGRINYGTRRGYRGGYVAPVIIGGGSYVQSEANQQLIYLEQTRAGLLAQWQILEEQARRAGIRID
jgi:type II secretory pathway pseudopilin PulG